MENTSRMEISTPNVTWIWASTRMATSECPPRSKKLSCAPTRSTRSTCAQISASTSSTGVRGATYVSSAPAYSGAGSARRATFPLGVSGSASSTTTADGTMYSGRRPFRCVLSSAGVAPAGSAATTYATSRRSPGTSSRTTTTAARTSGWSDRTASTSPGSIRKPRTLTCSSVRPRYSTSPFGSHRARSPVRYSRPPGVPNGSGTNFSAVRPGRPR
jgi:hypothetical protein